MRRSRDRRDPFFAGQVAASVAAAAAAAPSTPLTILGAACLQWCRADLGLTIGVGFTWLDQSGNGKDYSNAVAAAGPSLTAADATLSNLATLQLNGSTQSCQSALQLSAPGTVPSFFWMIARQDAWTSNANMISGDGGQVIRQSASSPNIRLVTGGTLGLQKSQAAVNEWIRIAGWSTNSVSDYLKVQASLITDGINTGNVADTTAKRSIGVTPSGLTFCQMSIAEIVYANTDSQLASLDAYGTARYGAALF